MASFFLSAQEGLNNISLALHIDGMIVISITLGAIHHARFTSVIDFVCVREIMYKGRIYT